MKLWEIAGTEKYINMIHIKKASNVRKGQFVSYASVSYIVQFGYLQK